MGRGLQEEGEGGETPGIWKNWRWAYVSLRGINKWFCSLAWVLLMKCHYHSMHFFFLSIGWAMWPANNCCSHFLIPITSKSEIKVTKHSFQVPMPNSPWLLFNYLCFGTHLLQESRLTTEKFINTFWLGCMLLPWQWGRLKTRLNKWCLLIWKKSSC